MSFFRQKRVLVTGGAGFIGSHLVDALIAEEAQVTVLDNLSTGSLDNIKQVHSHITLIVGSVEQEETCLAATRNIDIIFHMAAFISVPESMKEPSLCFSTNVTGTQNILEAARKNNVDRLIFSSSCSVYGDQDIPCTENMNPQPASPYAYSKWLGEILCQQYATLFNVKTICPRYFNVYGPRQDPHNPYAGVVAKFEEQLLHKKPLTIFGDGLQMRDFIHVSDVVKAVLKCAQFDSNLLNGQAFNIASGKSITLLELAQSLFKKFPQSPQTILFKPARAGDVKICLSDCKKYQKYSKSNEIEV